MCGCKIESNFKNGLLALAFGGASVSTVNLGANIADLIIPRGVPGAIGAGAVGAVGAVGASAVGASAVPSAADAVSSAADAVGAGAARRSGSWRASSAIELVSTVGTIASFAVAGYYFLKTPTCNADDKCECSSTTSTETPLTSREFILTDATSNSTISFSGPLIQYNSKTKQSLDTFQTFFPPVPGISVSPSDIVKVTTDRKVIVRSLSSSV
jgi:hypothetical protein